MAERPLTAAGRERVVAAIRSGATIEAIRLYREDTLASLADAKRAVDAMAAAAGGAPPASASDANGAVVSALYAGRKIEAIKQYRLARRVDLRTAKEAVEAMERELRQSAPAEFASPPSSGGCGAPAAIVILIVAVALAVAHHFLR